MTEIRRAPPFWRNEDWLAVFLGGAVIALLLAGARPSLPRFKWATDGQYVEAAAAQRPRLEGLVKDAAEGGEPALAAAGGALLKAVDGGTRAATALAARQLKTAAADVREPKLRKRAETLQKELGGIAEAEPGRLVGPGNLGSLALLGLAILLLSIPGVVLLGGRPLPYAAGFGIVFLLSSAAQGIAGNSGVHYWGLEYVLFALALGLAVGNAAPLPEWLRAAARTEYFIKTGLVLLGCTVLFHEILQAGPRGMAQALLTVVAVWYVCYLLARRLKVDGELSVMLSTAVSICGVSAAIAACGAIQGDRKKLSYVTSLVLLVALPMMVVMPWMVRVLGIPEAVGGAWMGGTLDTTGSVVAAGALISEKAMQTGVIVKLSQNVLIGGAAFVLSTWWALRKTSPDGGTVRPSLGLIWERFPKFVLGFLAASLLFSFALPATAVAATKEVLSGARTAFFGLAFVSIGLETRLADLLTMDRGRPIVAFLGAQAFNMAWTLLLAWLLFGGGLIPA